MKATQIDIRIRKAAKAIGVNQNNIAYVEKAFGGYYVGVKDRQKAITQPGKDKIFVHHSQLLAYADVPMNEILFGEEQELI